MKTPRTIQTRRTRPKAGYRILHAATRLTGRKQRAATATATDEYGEVPGVGTARALVVILLLHVAAIAGIYIHNKWSEGTDIQAKTVLKNDHPTRLAELKPHTVNAGDDYDKIARKYGVDRDMLVEVNEGKTLEAGWIINIPNRRNEEIRPAEGIIGHVDPAIRQIAYNQTERPLIQSETASYEGSRPGELQPVEGADLVPAPAAEAILVKPPSRPVLVQTPAPQIQPVQSPAPAQPAVTGRRHVIRAGETLWRIASNNGVSVDALKRANPNVNVKALKIGASLVIPNRR